MIQRQTRTVEAVAMIPVYGPQELLPARTQQHNSSFNGGIYSVQFALGYHVSELFRTPWIATMKFPVHTTLSSPNLASIRS